MSKTSSAKDPPCSNLSEGSENIVQADAVGFPPASDGAREGLLAGQRKRREREIEAERERERRKRGGRGERERIRGRERERRRERDGE